MVTATIRMEAITTNMIMEKNIRDLKECFLNNLIALNHKSKQFWDQKGSAPQGLGPGVFIPYPFVEPDAQHQQDPQQQDADHPIDPIEGILQDHQKDHGKENDRRPFVPDPHEPRTIAHFIPLQLQDRKSVV